MAQIILSEAGAALGRRALSQGLNFAGVGLSGAAIGRAAGAFIGRAMDQAFADPHEGPRVSALPIMESREGAGIANVYGRVRVAGHLIWASRFREKSRTDREGGKGGAKVTNYTYSVSLAVALAEGEVSVIHQAYANGEPLDLSGVTHRFYRGDETQGPDPLIEMLEGSAPAYRGVAYIVFEDLPLEDFGNRLPQLSFEIERAPPSDAPGLANAVKAVNIIPASGEFVYATEIVRDVLAPGRERAINANSGEARADFLVSIDQLAESLPNVTAAALTVGWFGSSTDAGQCTIRPGVETRARTTRPFTWSVAGEDRSSAHLISSDASGALHYGGTPSDQTVIAAIQHLKSRGLAVTLTPFLFMDAPGLPWRGRISVNADRTAQARADIQAFVQGANGYRRFILHHASLAAAAGGVDAFLIGSEMRGATRVRDQNGAFPFVEALIALAHEVKALLPTAQISYAADWTEYGAYAPGDGSNDVLFPLDPLWASSAVDFIGIDWYPPMGDWRDGNNHADALAGYTSPDDPAYLTAQFNGGEAYDWYYASDTHRAAQIRTPIIDTAHQEHWIFRAKDIANWSANTHYPRPGGVRALFPTAFVPNSKPIRFCEIGFGAIDKGGNAPNLFIDPKSSESGLPPFSTGARDDLFQARALGTLLPLIEAQPEMQLPHVWAFDARPFPAWPLLQQVWGDGANWARGHWLNGRAGLSTLPAIIADLCARAGVTHIDVSGLDGAVEGYALDGPMALRGALEALRLAYGFHVIERGGVLVFEMEAAAATHEVSPDGLVSPGARYTTRLIDKAPQRLRLTYLDAASGFAPSLAEAREGEGDPRLVSDVTLPIMLNETRAEALASRLLALRRLTHIAEIGLPLTALALEPGDTIEIEGSEKTWRIDTISVSGFEQTLALVEAADPLGVQRDITPGRVPPPAIPRAAPDFVLIDAPDFSGDASTGPFAAAFADPWPGEITLLAGLDQDQMSARVTLTEPAHIARLLAPVSAGPIGRIDHVNALIVTSANASFESVTRSALLAGANALWLETALGWECLQFQTAALIGENQWRLSHLLRGQAGTQSGAAITGARLVFINNAARHANVSARDRGADLLWRAEGSSDVQTEPFLDAAHRPWPVAHLRQRGAHLHWTLRSRDLPDSWTLDDAAPQGQFSVAFDTGSGFGAPAVHTATTCPIPPGATRVRVAMIGADGRIGPAADIPLAA